VFQQFWTKRDGDELRLLGKFIDHGSHLCAIIYIKCLKGKQTDINYLSIPFIVRIIYHISLIEKVKGGPIHHEDSKN
jgi:hypothetical protein